MRLLHKELTYEVRGCIFDVHNELQTGFDEESYHLALESQLKKRGISFQSKPFSYLKHRGEKVHKFIADFLIEDRLILELKNIRSDFIPANYLQIISYLKHWQKDLGLLVNFGLLSVKIERMVYSERKPVLWEDYSAIERIMSANDKKHFENIRTVLLNILEMHGLGYAFSIYKTLFLVELAYQNIPFAPSILIPVKSDNQLIRHFELKVPLVANNIICGITAVQTGLEIHIATMKNYLRKTKTPIGVIANFGKEKLEIIGVHP